jgi:hypothetical protein
LDSHLPLSRSPVPARGLCHWDSHGMRVGISTVHGGEALMDSQRIAEIREWINSEKELYTRFCEEKNEEALHLVRARTCFMAFRDIPELLAAAEMTLPMPCGHSRGCQRWTGTGKEFCVACAWIDNEVAKKKKWDKKIFQAHSHNKPKARKAKKK